MIKENIDKLIAGYICVNKEFQIIILSRKLFRNNLNTITLLKEICKVAKN